jgi:predicted nucleic acid-binding protein
VRVIDSSALVKYFSREAGWEKVGEVMSEGVVTLDLAIKELSNALWKKVLKGEMNHEIAMRIIKDIVESKPFPIETQERYLLNAFEVAVKGDVTVYDALFIAMAKGKGLELVTCDEKQAEIAEKLGLKVILV